MSAQPVPYLTVEQYLEIERKAEYKSEYYQGVMWPLGGEPSGMAGGRMQHNLAAANVIRELGLALKGRCLVLSSDQRIRVSPEGLYTYADASVVCSEPDIAANDTLGNPVIIVEVISNSTEAADRGFKFSQYRGLASLREYVLVSQFKPVVEVFRRINEHNWMLETYSGLESSARLESTGCSIPLSEIFLGVKFD